MIVVSPSLQGPAGPFEKSSYHLNESSSNFVIVSPAISLGGVSNQTVDQYMTLLFAFKTLSLVQGKDVSPMSTHLYHLNVANGEMSAAWWAPETIEALSFNTAIP